MDNNTADDIAAIRSHMRDRECELRQDADRLHNTGATLDAWARELVADELHRYCKMLNRLEFQVRHAKKL